MIKKEIITDIQYIGRLSLTGKTQKNKKGKIILVEPKAVANLNFESPWKYNPPPAVGETIFAIPCDYREATTEQDIAQFKVRLFDENENVLGEAEVNSKESYAKYNYFAQTLQLKENFEKFYTYAPIKLKRKIYIECFLKKKKWKKELGWEILTEASKVLDFEINLQRPEGQMQTKPEVEIEVQPDRYSGSNCPKNCACSDIGRIYSFTIWVNNGEKEIIGGKITVSKGSLAFPITTQLPQKISADSRLGLVNENWKFSWNWQWFSEPDVLGYISWMIMPARFNYKISWELFDSDGYKYVGEKSQCVEVQVPPAKIKAAESYNKVVEAVWVYEILSLGILVLGLETRFIKTLKELAEEAGVHIGVGKTVEEYADNIKDGLMQKMRDPLKLVRNYKKPIKIKANSFATAMRAALLAQDRLYSADVLGKPIRKHRLYYNNCRATLIKIVRQSAKIFSAVALNTKSLKISQSDANILMEFIRNKKNAALIKQISRKFNSHDKNGLFMFLERAEYPINVGRKFRDLGDALRQFSDGIGKWKI